MMHVRFQVDKFTKESEMLQQILRDMYVDPEILAELDEDQKQTLFCKMREEQVRRWKAWNDKLGDEIKQESKRINKKKVKFLLGIDDEPWVWVMGEHENDRSIDDILREEAAEKARLLAEKETEKLREEVRKEMKAQLIEDYVDLTPTIEKNLPKLRIEDDMDIYCSVEQIQAKIHSMPKKNNNTYSMNYYPAINNKLNDTSEIKNTPKVAQKVALWEQKLLNDKTTEIFQKMQIKHQQVAKEAEEEEKRKDQVWREQERKAKAAEQQIREIARRAREEHKLNSTFHLDSNTYGSNNLGVPPGRQAVIDWYKNEEKVRSAGIDSSNNVMPWFHGLITRREAEKLLLDQPCGTFLIRLSERIWGYAVSYRAQEKCKHYLVNAIPKYNFVGNNQKGHDTLGDIITFHRTYPLTGGETLQYPCPRISTTAIEELFD